MDALEGVLRRSMLMVGVRAANLPNPEEKQILLSFVRNNFGMFTVAEILLAFEKAVAGELETEANCYENFSCEYFGKIMTAYKKWASQKFNENQMHLVPAPQIEQKHADFSQLGELYYQDYLNDKLNLKIMPAQIYEAAMKFGYVTADAYEDWIEDAKNTLLNWIFMEQQSASDEEVRELSEQIRKINNGEKVLKVDELAKKLCIRSLYRAAKHKKHKNLFGQV